MFKKFDYSFHWLKITFESTKTVTTHFTISVTVNPAKIR